MLTDEELDGLAERILKKIGLSDAPPQLAVNIPEAATRLGVSPGTVHVMINRGDLAARKYGKLTFILTRDLEELIASLPFRTEENKFKNNGAGRRGKPKPVAQEAA